MTGAMLVSREWQWQSPEGTPLRARLVSRFCGNDERGGNDGLNSRRFFADARHLFWRRA
ncbi:MAG: hypothetical protein ACR2P4_00620 [Gammaproteobacteria bacterium]